LGSSIAIDDINRDGRADLILGAPGASGPDNIIQYAGEVYLWPGQALTGQRFIISSQALWTIYGEKTYAGLGWAITTGDFDNDKFSEILLGCTSCVTGIPPFYLSGRGYVIEPLQFTGMVTVTAVSQLDVIPYKDSRCLGLDVDAMDFDGDGINDMLISSPCTDDPEGTLPGSAFAISYPIHYRIYLSTIITNGASS
jgi:hypothetical protein